MRESALAACGVVALLAGGCGPRAGDERTNPRDGAAIVWVPGTRDTCGKGGFRMGSRQEEIDRLWSAHGWSATWKRRTEDETPPHQVKLPGFWIYKHEVTNAQYDRFLRATGHPPPPHWSQARAYPQLPVIEVTWGDAQNYCRWARAQLPTAAQWEYAARGPESRLFPWGDEWDRARCNSAEHLAGKPLPTGREMGQVKLTLNDETWGATMAGVLAPVGSFAGGESWCGAQDMAGNVSEWCADWYGRDFYAKPAATRPDPQCFSNATGHREARGGAWNGAAFYDRGAHHMGAGPDGRYPEIGFRPVVRCPVEDG